MAFLNRFLNFLIAFVNAFLLIFNVSPVDPGAHQIDMDRYELVFEDEFDGNTLDSAKWRAHNSEGIRKGGYWCKDMAAVSDGNLTITTKYLEDGRFGSGWYTAGLCPRRADSSRPTAILSAAVSLPRVKDFGQRSGLLIPM